MGKLKHTLFLSCLKATELIEKKLQFSLSVKEKLQLRIHKMMCTACTLYEKQSAFIEKGLSENQKEEQSPEEIGKLKMTISNKLSDL